VFTYVLFRVLDATWRLKVLATTDNAVVRRAASVLYNAYSNAHGFYIDPLADFAGRPVFPHGTAAVHISGGSRIGRNCVIFQGVTVGSITLADSSRQGAPVLGDNCYLAAGAKIVGPVTLGDNVRVGPNAVVLAGRPTVLQRETLDNRHFRVVRGVPSTYDDGRWVALDRPC